MEKTLIIAALMALPFGLSGCGKEAEAPKAEATADTMGDMAMPAENKTGKGTGTVTAVDAVEGKITLDHGPIAAVGWPAMKMSFSAEPKLLTGIAAGDNVEFDVIVTGNAGEVTAIRKH